MFARHMFEQVGQPLEIAGIHGGKGHRFALFVGHVQAIVPVGILKTGHVMRTDMKKSHQVLYQNVLQQGARINGTIMAALGRAHTGFPLGVDLPRPVDQMIFKVRLLA